MTSTDHHPSRHNKVQRHSIDSPYGDRPLAKIRTTTSRSVSFSFWMLIIYTISFLLHLPERVPFIAILRPDLILLGFLAFSLIGADWKNFILATPSKLIIALCLWIFLTIPFVEWPGSVLREGWKPFLKAVIFFYAIVLSITDRRRLAIFLVFFLGCQSFRIIEPLFLHITEGYWGNAAHIGGGVFLDRLSGAPADVTNPNGLAYLVTICVALMHPLMARSSSRLAQAIYATLLPIFLYTLSLTGSRSGAISLGVVIIGLIITSKRKLAMGAIMSFLLIAIWTQFDSGQRDRYMSVISSDTDNAATAQGRIHSWESEFKVALMNPFFGHGIASSREAIGNEIGGKNVSHNLFAETIIEVGVPGSLIFFFFLLASFRVLWDGYLRSSKDSDSALNLSNNWFQRLTVGLTILFVATLISSLAQYGLTESHWYFICGFIVASAMISNPPNYSSGLDDQKRGQ